MARTVKVAEYRDLIDDLSDTLASAKSAATFEELGKETDRLQRKRDELTAAACPTARPKDAERAARLLELSRQFICDSLMATYDNQRIEDEYLGRETPFVNPSRFESLKPIRPVTG